MHQHLRLARGPGKTGASRREAAQPSRSAFRSRISTGATLVATSLSPLAAAREPFIIISCRWHHEPRAPDIYHARFVYSTIDQRKCYANRYACDA